jgi:hypothetical protein
MGSVFTRWGEVTAETAARRGPPEEVDDDELFPVSGSLARAAYDDER